MSISLKSPPVEASSSSDPFELDRLAEELAFREVAHSSDEKQAHHDLPIYVPLSHENPHLSADAFDVEEFLLSRSYTSLPDLRSELREYLATLKEELVKLINDDYEAFISLSTDLRGEGARLERLKYPLGDVKSQILESRRELQLIQDAIQEKLKKRSSLREEKTFLQLLLKISDSVTRLESLLLIALPGQDSSASDLSGFDHAGHLNTQDDDGHEDRLRGNRAKHLSRVAAEYTQLLYHVTKAQSQKSAFVDEIQWRVDRIRSTLSSDLDHLFASTVVALTNGKDDSGGGLGLKAGLGKGADGEKAKLTADLTECLRTYDSLGLWKDAEEVLKREVVRSFVKKTIFPGALNVPHSPILPHTPLPTHTRPTGLTPGPLTASHPPRTPYTPYTAFASKQNPFELTFGGNTTSSSVPLLDDSDNALAGLYNQILRFVDRDLTKMMDVAQRVCTKSGSRSAGVTTMLLSPIGIKEKKPKKEKEEAFEIMANVVWAEIGRAVMDELGSVVFAAGRPDEFRKNHETTQAFLRSLEFLAPSISAIESMRSHPVYTAFERRWQLPVYFQLRWKEIVGKLEENLGVARVERAASKDGQPFVTAQAAAVWTAITTCWSAEVYIPELSHRFWRLTLQLLSRYKTWLDNSLPPLEPMPKSAVDRSNAGSSPTSLSRASTPVPPTETASPETVAKEDDHIRQFATAITDIRVMETQVKKLWREELSMMLPESQDLGSNEEIKYAEDALKHALDNLASLIHPLSNQIIAILTRRALEAVQSVRSIPASLRAMSLKRAPSEPSYFVSTILQPVKMFFGTSSGDGVGSALREDFLKPYSNAVFESAVQRYIFWITSLRKTEVSLRRLNMNKKQGFSLFGNASTGRDDRGRDEERIRTQMIMDVEAFGKDAKSLGVDVEASEAFKALTDMVHASLSEESS